MDVVNRDTAGAVNGRTRSDVALFHEMVHALHQTRGTLAPGFVGVHTDTYDDPILEADKDVSNDEYQAAGLGAFSNDPLTENAYRAERPGIAKSGKGIAGDMLMPQREAYSELDWYQTLGGA